MLEALQDHINFSYARFWKFENECKEISGTQVWREGGIMRKQRIEYDSPVDSLVAVAKRLSNYESQYQMASEEFFDKFSKGQSEDSEDFVEWANDCQHYLGFASSAE